MASIYLAKSNNEQAAKILEKINLENTSRQVSAEEKARVYVQIAEIWFEEDDAVNAEKFINKAAHIIHLVKAQEEVHLRYKVCHARIMDSKRRFLVAAHSYYDLSNQEGVLESNLMPLLEMSLTCALLAPAGP